MLIGCYSVTVTVKASDQAYQGTADWWLTAVYGPQEDGDRSIFLEEPKAIRDACDGPWAITGDFNLILSEADKNNDRIDRTNLRRFRRTLAALELQDLHLHCRSFTWSNERDTPTLVRLDRVLVSKSPSTGKSDSQTRIFKAWAPKHRTTAPYCHRPTLVTCRRLDFTSNCSGLSSTVSTR